MQRYFSQRELLDKVPHFFLIMAAITFVLNIVGLSMMFEKKEPNSDKADLIVNDALGAAEPAKPLLYFKQLIRRPEIYMLTILYSFFNIGSF